MDSLIQTHWNRAKPELPGIDCIAYPDGRVTILNFIRLYSPATKTHALTCAPLCDTHIDSIERYNAACWTCASEWSSIDYANGKIRCGSGGMGNEGYIARTDETGGLVWGLFSEATNPIRQLELQGSTLIATSEHGDLQLAINLNQLTDIQITLLAKA